MNRQEIFKKPVATSSGLQFIKACKVKWVSIHAAVYSLIALELAVSVHLLLGRISAPAYLKWALVAAFLILIGIRVLQLAKATLVEMAAYLDRLFPELEESCVLLLKPAEKLNSLETMQVQHLLPLLPSLYLGRAIWGSIRRKLVLASFLLIPFIILVFVPAGIFSRKAELQRLIAAGKLPMPLHSMPGAAVIKSLVIHILPPAYTHKAASTVSLPELTLVQDTRVSWVITTSKKAEHVFLKLNGGEMIAFRPDNSHTRWILEKTLAQTGFYQLSIENKLSAYYKISILKDLPPAIRITSPEQYTTVKFGGIAEVPVKVRLIDDYGLSTAILVVTTAKGSGEAIKFKEQKLVLSPVFNGFPLSLDLHQQLSLHSLNIEPGDELYFYVQATDNRGQRSRSDTYYINMADTAKLSLVSGQVKGISPVPEYFRSERQLIMDTEKLLAEHLKPFSAAFKERSNDLGIDQKLLRQRYSKFLGEESESDDPAPAKNEAPPDRRTVAGADAAMNMFTEKSESADEGDSFEPLIKAELKAALSQMFSAEVLLRTFQPRQALPYEYKALRLLKLVQEKTRAYVSKTAFSASPHQAFEKRLSGDLSKIGDPVLTSDVQKAHQADLPLREAMAMLDQVHAGKRLSKPEYLLLERAGMLLAAKAIEQPGIYLSSIAAMHQIINSLHAGSWVSKSQVRLVQHACMLGINKLPVVPSRAEALTTEQGLSSFYFKKIHASN